MTALATLACLNVSASTPWTGVTELTNEAYYYIVNTETGLYLGAGQGWNTRATINRTPTGRIQAIRLSEGHWKLKFEYKGDGLVQTGDSEYENIFTDRSNQANYQWNVMNVGGTDFTIQLASDMGGYNADYYLAPKTNGISIVVNNSTSATLNKWRFVTESEINDAIANSVEGTYVDVSTKMYNVQQHWNGGYGAQQWNTNGDFTAGFMEKWTSSGGQLANDELYYEMINMPAGHYRFTADVIATQQSDGDNDTYGGVFVYINNSQVECMTKDGITKTYSVETDLGEIGTIRVGTKIVNTTCNWTGFGNVKLEYYKVDPLKAYKALLAQSIEAAEAVEESTTTPAAYAAVQAALRDYSTPEETEEAYRTAIEMIDGAVATANALIVPYARYNSIKNAAMDVAANLNTNTADTEVEDAITTAAIDDAIATLRAAFLAELPKLTIGETGYIDVTSVMVDNAGVHTNTVYWTIEGTPNSNYSWAVCNYGECEFYNQNFKFYQTLALTPGTWEFGVTGFHRAGNHSTYFYAGDDKILIPGVESSVVDNMAEAKTYFDNGNGKVALKFLIETAGDVEIGIDNQDTETDKWTIFRDFTLKYYGARDYSVYESRWTELVGEANDAKTAHPNVTGSELTALNTAIDDSPAGSNLKATYIAKITALEDALTTFTAAAPSYDKYVAYRAETVTLFGEELAATVDAPTSAAEALVAVQNLNIAQYNKVRTDYPYSLTSKIGDFSTWTGTAEVGTPRVAGTPNSLDWEHWSGTTHPYYEQDGNGYNNAGGWTIQYTKTTTLPAGDYVVKVAARSSAGVTSSITITANNASIAPVIALPCVGNRARGIATDGTASWSDEKEYILENQGGGWEWRFVPFTLDAETEVTMTFYAEASTQAQWMSIGDGELLSATNIATAVAYDEEAANTIEDVDVANVTISRTIKVGYNTVCLPFDLTLGQVESAFGSGTEVYAFSESSADPMNATINFNKVVAGTITANVPVLVKATAASTEQVFEGVQVKAAESAVVEGTNFDFVGLYAPLSTIPEGDYFIGNGALYKSKGATSMKAFRAYIKVKTAGANVKMFINDEGVDAISLINDEPATGDVIFNIIGQRVNKAQKGLYIVNGKKVLVK